MKSNNTIFNKLPTLIYIVTVFIFISAFSGCSQSKNEPEIQKQSHESTQEAEKIPDDLKKLEYSIESIFKILNGPASKNVQENMQNYSSESASQKTGMQTQKNHQTGTQNQSIQQSSSQNQEINSDNQTSGEKEESKQEGLQQNQVQDIWSEVNFTITNMHYQWNGYLPVAAKKGASKKQVDDFSNALNYLTVTSTGKNKLETFLSANSLYSLIPDFARLYRTENSPEIKRIRYYVRNIILNSEVPNWEQALNDTNNLKSTWAIYKNTIPEEQHENADRLDYSIYEIEKAVNNKNVQLIEIKGKVCMTNIDDLEKSLEESQQNKSSIDK